MEQEVIHDIELDKIFTPPDRFRRDNFGDLQGLQFSIEQLGLLNPIIVEPMDDGRFRLIAGERRFLCFQQLRRPTIQVRFFQDLDDLSRKEIEYEENYHRKDHNWVEEIRAEQEIHKLKKIKYQDSLPGKFGRQWGQKETAEQLDISEAKLSIDLGLADALTEFPELEKFPNRREAQKQLRRLKAGAPRKESDLLIKIKESFVAQDITEGLKAIPVGSVDLIIADLSVDLNTMTILELRARLAPTGNGFLFFNLEQHGWLVDLLTTNNFHFRKKPYIWHVKGDDTYQTFMWFSKALASAPKALREHLSHRKDLKGLHTLAKPYTLIQTIVEATTLKGAFVLDPMAYGPSVVRVCLDLGRNCRAYCPNKILYDQYVMEMEKGL